MCTHISLENNWILVVSSPFKKDESDQFSLLPPSFKEIEQNDFEIVKVLSKGSENYWPETEILVRSLDLREIPKHILRDERYKELNEKIFLLKESAVIAVYSKSF